MLHESTYQPGLFTDIPVHSAVQYNILKNTFMDFFFMNGRICRFSVISFKCSINYFLEYRHMTKTIAGRLLTNFTFEL